MPEKYTVTLSHENRQQILQLTHQRNLSGRRFKRAQILLLADEGHRDETIAQMLYVGESTVHRIRQKFVVGGVEFALSELPRPGSKRKLDGKAEAFLVATTCSDPPAGRAEWTMQLLAEQLVEVQLVGLRQISSPNKAQSSFESHEYVSIVVQPLHKTERHRCPKCL